MSKTFKNGLTFHHLSHLVQSLLASLATLLTSMAQRLTRRATTMGTDHLVTEFLKLKASLSAQELWTQYPGLCWPMLKAGHMNDVGLIPYGVLEACGTVNFQPDPMRTPTGGSGFLTRQEVASGKVVLCKDRPTRPGQGGTIAQTIGHLLGWYVPNPDLFHEDHWAVRNAVSLLLPDLASEDGQGTVSYVAKGQDVQMSVTDEMTLEWRGHRATTRQGFVPLFHLGEDAPIKRMVVAGKVEYIDAAYMTDCWMDWNPDGPNLLRDGDFEDLSHRIAMTALSLQKQPLEVLMQWAVNSDWRFLPTTDNTCMLLVNKLRSGMRFVDGNVLLNVVEEHRQGTLTPQRLFELMSPLVTRMADAAARTEAEDEQDLKALAEVIDDGNLREALVEISEEAAIPL